MNAIARPLRANGTLPLNLGWLGAFYRIEVIGGPFDGFEPGENRFGVCVRAERAPRQLDLHLPIRDFDVPHDLDKLRDVLKGTLQAAFDGKEVYVGCMGGWGRTGLFLALLAKAAGIDDPIAYVREHYTPRAVETEEQARFVRMFDVVDLRSWLVRTAWTKWWLSKVFWWR